MLTTLPSMNRLAIATTVCVGVIVGCGTRGTPGSELSFVACRDGIDNDGDGAIDCDDSDCRAIPCLGSGTTDAASDAVAVDTCDPICRPGETCRDQVCGIALPATLVIKVLSMDGPGGAAGVVPICADSEPVADCGIVGLKLVCTGCPPDPYVRIDLERPRTGGGAPTVTSLGQTRPATNMEAATWDDLDRWGTDPNPLHLEPGDTLRLVALDFDDVEDRPPDDLLFGCSIAGDQLRIGAQSCISKPSVFAQSDKPEFDIWVDVRLP